MFTFGAGVMFGTPLQDATGAAISNPSPIEFAVLQDVTVDESYELKELYGAYQFPVAVGRGKGKMNMKAKAANINAQLANTFLYGLTLTAGYEAIIADRTGTAVPTSPYAITPTTATVAAELGVTSAVNGVPYTRVASSPTAGQYSYAAGTWTFSSLDQAKTVFISYAYNKPAGSASGKYLPIQNLLMGVAPVFQVDLQQQYLGKTWYLRFPQCISTKFSRTYKNDDFTIPEFDIDSFADAAGNIAYLWAYE